MKAVSGLLRVGAGRAHLLGFGTSSALDFHSIPGFHWMLGRAHSPILRLFGPAAKGEPRAAMPSNRVNAARGRALSETIFHELSSFAGRGCTASPVTYLEGGASVTDGLKFCVRVRVS